MLRKGSRTAGQCKKKKTRQLVNRRGRKKLKADAVAQTKAIPFDALERWMLPLQRGFSTLLVPWFRLLLCLSRLLRLLRLFRVLCTLPLLLQEALGRKIRALGLEFGVSCCELGQLCFCLGAQSRQKNSDSDLLVKAGAEATESIKGAGAAHDDRDSITGATESITGAGAA